MLDPKKLRKDFAAVAANLARRGEKISAQYPALEEKRKELQIRVESLEARRNALARDIGRRRGAGENTNEQAQEAKETNERLHAAKADFEEIKSKLEEIELRLPNLLDDSVVDGKGADDNPTEREWGEKPDFDFAPRDHVEIGERLGLLDFETARAISGSRFAVLRGDFARLHRALAAFMLDLHTQKHGYAEINAPHLVNRETITGTGQLPKFEEDIFAARDEKLFLIPTAEVPLANLAAQKIVDEKSLPQKFACHSPCYRREAGAAGKDTRGMLRQHQFEKVELVQIVHPSESDKALEEMTNHAETVLRQLELPYRVVSLCAGDTGFAAAKTYDLEVWLPGQSAYREISSCSNCRDFQARRMKARFRARDGEIDLVHTLNGSGVAVGRALIAVVENHQTKEGGIRIPDALRNHFGGAQIDPPRR